MEKINLKEKFNKFDDHWNPRIISRLNGQAVKIAKLKGDFIWHDHKEEDELFYVVKGKLSIEFRDKTVDLEAGEMLMVPRGIEHRPYCKDEVWVMLFEPDSTKHTGDVVSVMTKNEQKEI